LITAGVSLGHTSYGKPLKDGGACIAEDGRIVAAIAEDRLTRRKHDGGYQESLATLLRAFGLTLDDIDAIVVSSCCDTALGTQQVALQDFGQLARPQRIIRVGHHASHAASTFYTSPFDEAVVVVIDAGGDVLSGDPSQWWTAVREQHSYYVGRGDELALIGRDFTRPKEAGFGEVFRAFTYFLGWPSHVHSEKVMALAAYGEERRFPRSMFNLKVGRLESAARVQSPEDPFELVRQTYALLGVKTPNPRRPTEPFESEHADMASFVQRSLREALAAKVQELIETTGIRNVCLAGGVALNCLANGYLLEHTDVEQLYIQPAAGDHGQCLGNALMGTQMLGGRLRSKGIFDPYLGPPIAAMPPCSTDNRLVVSSGRDAIKVAAALLARGDILAWYSGRSEFGPRALGGRSILAHPQLQASADRIRTIKGRPTFCPFAPSILASEASKVFSIYENCHYMTMAVQVVPEWRSCIAATVHVDGTARVHVVPDQNNSPYHQLLTAFFDITGLPVVLNTSLNLDAEPIVETPGQAWQLFMHSDIDALYLDGVLFAKREYFIDRPVGGCTRDPANRPKLRQASIASVPRQAGCGGLAELPHPRR